MKGKHTYDKKMTRSGRTKVIYKRTFVSKQSLICRMLILFRTGTEELQQIKSIFLLVLLNGKYVHVFVRVAGLGPNSSKGSNHR